MGIRLAMLIATLGLLVGCQYPWTQGERSCADGSNLDLPVDLAQDKHKGTWIPFGIHGQAYPEGHTGIDFNFDATDAQGEIEVLASYSAEILSVTAETEYPGSSCIVMDSACIQVNICHLQLKADLKPGSRVKRGDKLGTVSLIRENSVSPGESPQKFSLHFGTYSGKDAELTCPSELLDPEAVRFLMAESLFQSSSYPEAWARNLVVQCENGSKQTFSLPPETTFCAPRLPAEDRARMNSCLGSTCAGIW